MAESSPDSTQQALVEAICRASADAFSQALKASWTVEAKGLAAPSPEAPALYFFLSFSKGMQGSSAIGISVAEAQTLARKLSASEETAIELNDAQKESLTKLLQQIAESAAALLEVRYGPVEISVALAEKPGWAGETVSLHAAEGSTSQVVLQLLLGPDLSAAAAATETAAEETVATESQPVAGPGNLDLLLGVGLNITLRFGQRVLTLREILELGSGSVIELDRQVQEPADLLLGDKLIARGEVVIVDGNYGIRVTEVSDPHHRLSTL